MKRRFEFAEGGSQKFWEVEVVGSAFTVRFGRLGTDGQSKTTACASSDAAVAEMNKLIREKLKKGYQEVGAAERNWRPPVRYDLYEHLDRFLNYAVARYNPAADGEEGEDGEFTTYPTLRDIDRRVYAIHFGYDDGSEDGLEQRLGALLRDPKAAQLKALIIGSWFDDVCDEGPEPAVKLLAEHGPRLTALKGLFAGDVVQEEAEISWIHQSDWGPAVNALPALEELVIRGGEGMRLSTLKHRTLTSLTLQSGGLPVEVVRDLGAAELPALRNLTLWLGCENYGGTTAPADLAPILAGERFPQLEFLGLMNSDRSDDLAKAVAAAPILGRLKGLDLSMGTLGDEGGRALLASPAIRSLKYLNLRHHYLSPEVMKAFRGLGIEVDVSDPEEGEDEDRYPEVTE